MILSPQMELCKLRKALAHQQPFSMTWLTRFVPLAKIAETHLILLILQDFDPLAERRIPRIADRLDEYRSRQLNRVLSPARIDPFAEGNF